MPLAQGNVVTAEAGDLMGLGFSWDAVLMGARCWGERVDRWLASPCSLSVPTDGRRTMLTFLLAEIDEG